MLTFVFRPITFSLKWRYSRFVDSRCNHDSLIRGRKVSAHFSQKKHSSKKSGGIPANVECMYTVIHIIAFNNSFYWVLNLNETRIDNKIAIRAIPWTAIITGVYGYAINRLGLVLATTVSTGSRHNRAYCSP